MIAGGRDLLAARYFTIKGCWLAYSCHCALIRARSHFTFSICMDPLTNDGGPGCYHQLAKISPPMGLHH